MQAVAFYLILPFLYLISILPFRVLYFISRFLVYPLLYNVVGYRKKVVELNLQNSFPEKTKSELKQIEKDFYKYLADLFMEIIKCFTISEAEISKRFSLENFEIIQSLYEKNKSVVITLGHIGNYELMGKAIQLKLQHQAMIPYKKMSNEYFNQFFYKSRSKFGTIFFPTFDTYSFLKKDFGRPFALVLGNDQSAHPNKCYWTKFLNQDTSFFVGTERIARQFDVPVVFAHVTVPQKGHYCMTFELVTDKPKTLDEGEIMQKHAQMLENDIVSAPHFWLWTHKRWKHKMPEGYTYGFTKEKRD